MDDPKDIDRSDMGGSVGNAEGEIQSGALVAKGGEQIGAGSEDAIAVRTGSPLIASFPWMTNAIMRPAPLEENLSEDNPMRTLGRKIDYLLEGVANSPKQDYVDLKGILDGSSLKGTVKRARHVFPLACVTMAVARAYDMAVKLEGRHSAELDVPRHIKTTYGEQGQLKDYFEIHDWVDTIKRAKECMEGLKEIMADYDKTNGDDTGSKLTSYIKSAEAAGEALQITRNFTYAALFLHIVMNSPEQDAMLNLPTELIPFINVGRKMAGLEEMSQTRPRGYGQIPFIAAALFSPIHLLRPNKLASQTFDRCKGLMFSKAWGNEHPPEVEGVVLDLWRLIFDISVGKVSPAAGIFEFLSKDMTELLDSPKDADFRTWYQNGETNIILDNLVDRRLREDSRDSVSPPPPSGDIMDVGADTAPPSQNEIGTNDQSDDPALVRKGNEMEMDDDDPSHKNAEDVQVMDEDPPAEKANVKTQKGKEILAKKQKTDSDDKAMPVGPRVSQRIAEQLAKREAETDSGSESDAPKKRSAPKKKSAASKAKSVKPAKSATPALKRKREYSSVDLLSSSLRMKNTSQDIGVMLRPIVIDDIEVDPVAPDLDFKKNVELHSYNDDDTKLTVFTPRGSLLKIRPASPDPVMTETLARQIELSMSSHQPGTAKPLWSTQPARSMIALGTDTTFGINSLSAQISSSSAPVLVIQGDGLCAGAFDEATLEEIQDLQTVCAIKDQTQYPFESKEIADTFWTNCFSAKQGKGNLNVYVQNGSLRQILQCVEAEKGLAIRNNILHATDIPMPMGVVNFQFCSDIIAWKGSENLPYCKLEDVQTREIRWADVGTTNAYTCWRINSNGWATFFTCKTGQIVVFVRGNTTSDTSSSNIDSSIKRYSTHLKDSIPVEAVCLEAGDSICIMPNVCYSTFTVRDSICVGGNFYHHSSMMSSLFGFIHMLMAGESAASPPSDSRRTAAYNLLHRMMMFHHKIFSIGLAVSATNPSSHDLSLTTTESMLNMFSLCALVLWSNAFALETYQPAGDVPIDIQNQFGINNMTAYRRSKCAFMKKVALTFVRWLYNCFEVAVPGGKLSLDAIFVPFVGNLIVQMLLYFQSTESGTFKRLIDCSVDKFKAELLDPFYQYKSIRQYVEIHVEDGPGSLLHRCPDHYTISPIADGKPPELHTTLPHTPLDKVYFDGLDNQWEVPLPTPESSPKKPPAKRARRKSKVMISSDDDDSEQAMDTDDFSRARSTDAGSSVPMDTDMTESGDEEELQDMADSDGHDGEGDEQEEEE